MPNITPTHACFIVRCSILDGGACNKDKGRGQDSKNQHNQQSDYLCLFRNRQHAGVAARVLAVKWAARRGSKHEVHPYDGRFASVEGAYVASNGSTRMIFSVSPITVWSHAASTADAKGTRKPAAAGEARSSSMHYEGPADERGLPKGWDIMLDKAVAEGSIIKDDSSDEDCWGNSVIAAESNSQSPGWSRSDKGGTNYPIGGLRVYESCNSAPKRSFSGGNHYVTAADVHEAEGDYSDSISRFVELTHGRVSTCVASQYLRRSNGDLQMALSYFYDEEGCHRGSRNSSVEENNSITSEWEFVSDVASVRSVNTISTTNSIVEAMKRCKMSPEDASMMLPVPPLEARVRCRGAIPAMNSTPMPSSQSHHNPNIPTLLHCDEDCSDCGEAGEEVWAVVISSRQWVHKPGSSMVAGATLCNRMFEGEGAYNHAVEYAHRRAGEVCNRSDPNNPLVSRSSSLRLSSGYYVEVVTAAKSDADKFELSSPGGLRFSSRTKPPKGTIVQMLWVRSIPVIDRKEDYRRQRSKLGWSHSMRISPAKAPRGLALATAHRK